MDKSKIRYMFAEHPKLAKEFAKKTVELKHLPQSASKKPMMKQKLSKG